MNWTNEQQAAIGQEGCNLLVSAAAGSGKTAVLTERIVRLVAAGTDIDRFLVVTFTEAATAEMKRRISARLFQAAKEADEASAAPEAGARLRTQALSVGRANISTLHRFCLYVLRRNFHRLGLDPGFRPADEVQSAMLQQQALEDTAQSRYEAEDPAFLGLLRAVGGEEKLFSQAQELYGFLLAQPDPWQWLDLAERAYAGGETEFLHHPALNVILEDMRAQAAGAVSALEQARDIVPSELIASLGILDEDAAQVRALKRCKSLAAYRTQLLSIEFAKFNKWPRGDSYPEEKKQVQALRDAAKAVIRAQQKSLVRPLAEEAACMAELKTPIAALCAFVRDMDAAYAELKRERGVVDFSDMEHFSLRALREEDVQSALRTRFQYVFLDEYQDSSRIQECLISAVRREDNVFLVGDVKQSIYRFRQADPGLFLEKLASFTGLPGAPGAQIHLNVNFRSERPVIDAVNGVFSRIMSAEVGELSYDERAALHLPARPEGGQDDAAPLAGCELHIIERGDTEAVPDAAAAEEDEENGEAPENEQAEDERAEAEAVSDAEAEATLAARRIRALMREHRYPDPKTGEPRALRYADFTVLLRAHRRAAEVWAQTLAKMGIPAYVQLTGGYFDAIEVQVFLNLLRVIDNRRQDIPLLSVLRSPVFGFSVEALIELNTAFPAETLLERLELCAESGAPLASRANGVLLRLEGWRREAKLLPLPEFLAQLLDETGFYDCAGALPGGRERQGNLDALLIRARDYAAAGFPCDIWSFLQYMDRAAATADMGRAQAGAADVVRVLSMHAAKGLEYPVVICAGLGQRFNRQSDRADLLCERELGLGVRMRLNNVRRDTLYRRAIAVRLHRQQLAEEMRILYVGMTRARTRLLLIGCLKDAAGRAREAAQAEITPAYCAKAEHYLHWLLPVAQQSGALPLFLHDRREIPVAAPAAAQPENDGIGQERLLEQIRARFAWRYPYAQATAVPSKRSVSELTHAHDVVLRTAPAFTRGDKQLTAAQRGTAVHAALRELNIAACPAGDTLPFVEAEMLRMVREGRLSPKEAQAVSAPELARFLESNLGLRLRRAKRVERELEFAANIPAESLPGAGQEEYVLLQGVIDCCFVEEGGWVLLDYKTDHVTPYESVDTAAAAHAGQLAWYADALEQLSGLPVRERIVVLLAAGVAVAV